MSDASNGGAAWSAAALHTVDWSTLPAPVDDGAAAHLSPCAPLPATAGPPVDLPALPGVTVVYMYPRTATPGEGPPDGWDAVPGARGCTPQSCSYRDRHKALCAAGADRVFGMSAQPTEYQAEAAARLHLPFPLLSDADGAARAAWRLPHFSVAGVAGPLLRRLTLVLVDGAVARCFYPVFPPDADAALVLAFLAERQSSS
jgi:peroxiredoxin